MPQISISDLQPIGTSLFTDSETYLKELTDTQHIQGGIIPPTTDTVDTIYTQNGSTFRCSDCMSITQRTTLTTANTTW